MNYLETQKLTKYFGDTHAVDQVDFQIGEGEVVSLIGSNGAGKTSLVNLISGLYKPDSGQILFRGEDVTRQVVQDRIKAGIARSFQIVNLFDELTVVDNVALAIFAREGKTRWFFRLADHDQGVWGEAHELLRQFGLDAKAEQFAGGISQGERKLLERSFTIAAPADPAPSPLPEATPASAASTWENGCESKPARSSPRR